MTLRQARLFLAAIERADKQRRLGDAVAARMAQAEGKVWKAFVKGLQRGS